MREKSNQSDLLNSNSDQLDPKNSNTNDDSYTTANTICKKQIDHSLYWKVIVQDYAKNLDDSAREKDLFREQALGYLNLFDLLFK